MLKTDGCSRALSCSVWNWEAFSQICCAERVNYEVLGNNNVSKVYVFHSDSHSLGQTYYKNLKNSKIKAYLGVAHPLQSFMMYRMKRLILKIKFWIKNRTSNPPNDLNLQYIPLPWTKFWNKIEFEILPPGGLGVQVPFLAVLRPLEIVTPWW